MVLEKGGEMVKVFLVEDELIMRRGIKNKIPWEQEGFEFVGEASDGELAYPIIMKEKPDILITDIKMPFMDGLELSALVKKELPNIKIIILSGYDEFDFAKQAIEIGVTEYLLKPVSSQKLLETIKKVGKIIKEEKEKEDLILKYKQDNIESFEKEKEKLFYSLVDCSISVREVHEKGKKLGMDFTAPFYTVVLLRIISSDNEAVYQKDRVHIEEKIDVYLDRLDNAYYFKRWGEGWFLLLKSETQSIDSQLDEIKEFMSKTIVEGNKLTYFGGVGTTVQRLRDIGLSFRIANKVCASRFFIESNQIITLEDMRLHETSHFEKDELGKINISSIDRECLINFLKIGVIEEAESFLDAYLKTIGIDSYQSLIFRQYLMVDMYFLVIKFIEELGIDVTELAEKFGDVEEIKLKIHSKEGVSQYMKKLFREALILRDNYSKDKYNNLLTDAKTYVEQNFSNNEMSLNLVASHIGLSPSYFSTVFRQETGNTFVEYLTELRMNKAKELLKCTNKKTAEIAFDIGYKDPHYFSYIFKKTQKLTPKEYRNS